MEEKVYYQNGDVTVTPSRFVNAGKTYAMRNISSVQIGVIMPNNTSIILLGIGVLVFMLIIGGIATKIVAIVLGVGGFYLLKRQKPKYSVRINSNSGEVDGLISENREYIQTIVNAMNDAISHPVH